MASPRARSASETARDEKAIEGEKNLREAEKWLAHWRLSGRAINARGELVWEYDPSSTSNKVTGGSVWRLLIHDEHVWLCDRETKEFDRGVTAKDARKEVVPTDADISEGLSST